MSKEALDKLENWFCRDCRRIKAEGGDPGAVKRGKTMKKEDEDIDENDLLEGEEINIDLNQDEVMEEHGDEEEGEEEEEKAA